MKRVLYGGFVCALAGILSTAALQAQAGNGAGLKGDYFSNIGLAGAAAFAQIQTLSNRTIQPLPPPPASFPTGLTATPGNARITLEWTAVPDATGYKVYRATTHNGQSTTPIATIAATTFLNTSLTNGTTYYYKVAAYNSSGNGPLSNEVSATPVAPPPPPPEVAAIAADGQVTLRWSPVAGADSYNIYRSMEWSRTTFTPIANVLGSPFLDVGLTNGPTYFYKVTSINAGGEGARSVEASASPEGPPPAADPATVAAFRFLNQATWGPKPGDVDRLKSIGVQAFLDEQFSTPASFYPNLLFNLSVEGTQEYFMELALSAPDQLRQRVAWALHKIWVVSAVEVPDSSAMVTYQRILMNGAFGNYRDLMREITLNPAMGHYLNMLNNRSQAITGALPNENYARELMQLFTVGIPTLNQNGTPVLDGQGRQIPVYSEADVQELARIFTGWTFGDGNPATLPSGAAGENWKVPMEVVERYHDNGAKVFLGTNFAPGQTARQDLDRALDILFNHPNLGPFVARQLIQQFVTSNPSVEYVAAVAAVFNDNGRGVRGDIAATVRAVLTHPEAATATLTSGRLMEPALFVVSQLRALDAIVTDNPIMSDKAEAMGQKVFYPPSVFSYFSPGYRIRGTTLGGPEFQILTTVTALERTNFIAAVLGGSYGSNIRINYGPFTSRAANPPGLVDYCNLVFMGGQMSVEERAEIIKAVRISPASSPQERVRTAIYLTLAAAQSQIVR